MHAVYLAGICAAPDVGAAGTDAGATGAGTADGIWDAEPDAAGAGAPMAALSSRLLPPVVGRAWLKYANSSVVTKNTAARTAVVRDRKFALPLAPKRLPALPLPKAAPMSAPLPCCSNTSAIIDKADTTCTTTTRLNIMFIAIPFLV